MKIGKMGCGLARGFNVFRELEFVFLIIYWVLGMFTMSVVPFMRRQFGKNYLSWINILFGATITGVFLDFSGGVLLFGSGGDAATMMQGLVLKLFYYGFIGLCIWHRWVIRKKVKNHVPWLTTYGGIPLLMYVLPVSEETCNKWVEPLFLFVMSYVCRMFGIHSMSVWLLISALALMICEHVGYNRQERLLDAAMDARIESEAFNAALSGRPVIETQGFSLAQSTREAILNTPGLEAAFQSLPDDLAEIMDKQGAR